MPQKALIMYSSVTGNTEKVARRFKQVFAKKGAWGDWQCDLFRITGQVDLKNPPFHFDDYDFVCVGSPIFANRPAKEMTAILNGGGLLKFQTMPAAYGTAEEARPRTPPKPVRGIVFVTYTGDFRGPPEALPSLTRLEMDVEGLRVQVVGKFACPGKIWRKRAVDKVARAFYNGNVEETSGIIQRYKENPNSPEFASLAAEQKAGLDAAANETQHGDPDWSHRRCWHYNVQNRPGERDLLKAEIFLEEILEDYYQPDQPTEALDVSQYICIA